MTETFDGLRLVRVVEIPDEGSEGVWAFKPERFAADKFPLPVTMGVTVDGRLYKVGASIYFTGRLNGELNLSCARCLADFPFPVREDIETVFLPRTSLMANPEEVELSAEDMDVQFFEGDEINLFNPVRDQIALGTPISPLCDDKCKGLCPKCGVDKNREQCNCNLRGIDPRFAELLKLKRT